MLNMTTTMTILYWSSFQVKLKIKRSVYESTVAGWWFSADGRWEAAADACRVREQQQFDPLFLPSHTNVCCCWKNTHKMVLDSLSLFLSIWNTVAATSRTFFFKRKKRRKNHLLPGRCHCVLCCVQSIAYVSLSWFKRTEPNWRISSLSLTQKNGWTFESV